MADLTDPRDDARRALPEAASQDAAPEAPPADEPETREALQHELEQIRQRLRSAEARSLALTRELEWVYASRSWRVTAPLRWWLHRWHLFRGARQAGGADGAAPRLPGSAPKRALIALLHRLAGIGWLRQLALRVLNRLPGVKHRLQRLLAQVPSQAGILVRQYAPQEDFHDLLPAQRSAVCQQALQQRDTLLPRSALQATIGGLRLQGHVEGTYSLAAVNRHLIKRLAADTELPLLLAPHEGQPAARVHHTPGGAEEQQQLNALLDPAGLAPVAAERRMALYHHYPPIEAPDPAQGLPVALFFWEESEVPAEIVATFNRGYAGVVVTAWSVKKALMDSGCRVPVQVVTLPLEANPRAAGHGPHELARVAERKHIALLHVSSCFPRKGADVLLEAFDQLAARRRDVTLTLKTFPNPHNRVEAWIDSSVRPEHRDRLTLIMEDYDADAMAELYRQADVVVLPTRGEGLNMPGIEAGEFGRALAVTGYGAHTDFADGANSLHIAYRFAPAQSHLATGLSVWADPSPRDLAQRLDTLCRELLAGRREPLDRAKHLHSHVRQRFLAPQASDAFLSGLWRIRRYHDDPAAREAAQAPLGITLVTTWGEACGIAEYSRYLVEHLLEHPVSLRVLAPQGRPVQHDDLDGRIELREDWQHGQAPDIQWCDLHGDIVWLQHHFAFYSLGRRLGEGVAALREQGKRVYLTLHTTRPLLGFEKGRQQSAAACLAAFDRVFVHTHDDLNALKRLGITDNVTLMPQGVLAPAAADAPPAAEGGSPRLLGSFGFLLPHKGIAQLIEAFALARRQGLLASDSRLRLVTAVRDDSTSPHELERCRRLADRLGVTEALEWHTDFLPLPEVQRLLGECGLVLLPYQFTNESSSAAVRTAVAACPHVATTPAPIFDEVREITWPVAGFEPQDIVQALAQAGPAADEPARQALLEARYRWLEQRQWHQLASRYHALLQAGRIDERLLHPHD